MQKSFVLGVEGLDKLLGSFIVPPYVIVVAGHPGSGKTTLASTICYQNALKGHKCVYISLQENKEKLFRFMSNLGLDLKEIEAKGLFRFIKIPVTLDIESSIEMFKLVGTEDYDIVVVDSINALLESVKDDASRRAWLQNYFYSLPQVINGVGVLIAELPYGRESLELGGVEFVADAVLTLKHRVRDGFIARVLEIRKLRGAPTSLAEVPFTISEGKGIEVWVPPVLDEIVPEGGKIKMPCNLLKKTTDHLHIGQVMNITYPPDAEHVESLTIFLGIAVENGLKTLVISYRYPREFLREFVVTTLTSRGIDSEAAEEIVDNYMVFRGINPFSYGITQLLERELKLVEDVNADMVVFHGVGIVRHSTELSEHIKNLYNEVNYLGNRKKLVVRMGAYTDDPGYSPESEIADAIIKFERESNEVGEVGSRVYLWRRNRKAYIVTQKEINECINEIIEFIKTKLQR